ncbi:MAG: hypothetical protein J0L58_00685 [Burkholderiales bacterium]|nr:hypothetical protein [Burkholderiales bacterium]
MLNRRELGLGGLLGAWVGPCFGAKPLRFALSQSWGPPFLERQGSRVLGGVLPDLMTGMAGEVGRTPEFVLLPPARVDEALEDGGVDLHCLLAPQWVSIAVDESRWSVAVLVLRDVLVAAPGYASPGGQPSTNSPTVPMRGEVVGTVRGYRYPKLEADFATGRLQREDALDQWAVLEKLARGRSSLGVVNEFTFAAFQKRRAEAGLRVLRVVDQVSTHCLLGAKPSLPAEQLRAGIRRYVESGRLAEALEGYQLPAETPRSPGRR